MSWSFRVPEVSQGDVIEKVTDARDAYKAGNPAQSEEAYEQMDAACVAAASLVRSGSIGDVDKRFSVVLSGHANAGHGPVPGWSNDAVSVAVSQLAAVVKSDPEGDIGNDD